MTAPVTCCGLELRREEFQGTSPGTKRVVLSGSRGDLSVTIDGVFSLTTNEPVPCEAWEGLARVRVRWTGPHGEGTSRSTIAHAAGSTAQGCADTLAEMVRSVAAALAGVNP